MGGNFLTLSRHLRAFQLGMTSGCRIEASAVVPDPRNSSADAEVRLKRHRTRNVPSAMPEDISEYQRVLWVQRAACQDSETTRLFRFIRRIHLLMQPLRPVANTSVLRFAQSHAFHPADFPIRSGGGCRLNSEMERHLVRITLGDVEGLTLSPSNALGPRIRLCSGDW